MKRTNVVFGIASLAYIGLIGIAIGCSSPVAPEDNCFNLTGLRVDTTKIYNPMHVICNDSLIIVGVRNSP
jgi:hypothetical protein